MRHDVAVIGAGSWGTTLAATVARNVATMIWVRPEESEVADEINTAHTNETYVPGARFVDALRATTSLEEAVADVSVVVVAIPSRWIRGVLAEMSPLVGDSVPLVSLVKGLEAGSHKRMSEVIADEIPGRPVGALSGPNIAREVASGMGAATVLAFDDHDTAARLRPLFDTGIFRVYTNHDLAGVELGGALKNVIAIAAGMSDGAGGGENTRAAIVTRGLAEIARLGAAMGGEPATFAGLSGLGDLAVTCTSPHSRNRSVGEALGRGEKLEDILAGMHMVAEGVKSAPVVVELAGLYGVDMPIAGFVDGVISGTIELGDALGMAQGLEAGHESDSG